MTMHTLAEKRTVFESIKRGLPVTDAQFDAIYPPLIRRASETHWTGVDVAIRAAKLLSEGSKPRILDVGSGVGKFCMIGSAVANASFIGVERRPHLVEISRRAAREYGLKRVRFVQSDIREIDWKDFDAFYFFNPFVENLYRSLERIDSLVEFSQEKYVSDIRFTQFKLNEAKVGTRVVTYHGLGGEFPPGYKVKLRERWGDDYLVLWVKECVDLD